MLDEWSPLEDGRFYVSDGKCVNGSFGSVTLSAKGCRRYTVIGQKADQTGLALLLDTDTSRCSHRENLVAVIAGSVIGGTLLLVLVILIVLLLVRPNWLRRLTARKRRSRIQPERQSGIYQG